MGEIRTLKQRRADTLVRMRAALDEVERDLTRYARAHGGRYVIYGSAARDRIKPESDVDIVVDFDAAATREAWAHAERICHAHGLKPDVRPMGHCGPRLLDEIARHGKVLA